MKHIKLFEDFLNEASKYELKVLKSSLNDALALLRKEDYNFKQINGKPIDNFVIVKFTSDDELQAAKELLGTQNNRKSYIDESIITEAKVMDREEMISWLEDQLDFRFVDKTERFNGSTGGIWLAADDREEFKGKVIYDYYAKSSAYELGVLKTFAKELDKRGWYSEWNDPGTVMLWQN